MKPRNHGGVENTRGVRLWETMGKHQPATVNCLYIQELLKSRHAATAMTSLASTCTDPSQLDVPVFVATTGTIPPLVEGHVPYCR